VDLAGCKLVNAVTEQKGIAEPVHDLNIVLAALIDVFKQQFRSDQLTTKELYAKLIT
jgi:hypothetical protein